MNENLAVFAECILGLLPNAKCSRTVLKTNFGLLSLAIKFYCTSWKAKLKHTWFSTLYDYYSLSTVTKRV